jgi:DNA repair exonuclease SbcCD nuclease subunit
MGFRFIHTADWQVGKPFGHIPGDAGSLLRMQRIAAVGRIAELARDRGVDAVLVAGDAFDSNQVLDRTLIQTVDALKPFPGPWVFLPGNHDAALAHSVWTRLRRWGLPDNVIVADRPQPILAWGARAAVLPAPLRRRHEALDQTEWFDAAPTPEGAVRIGLAHGSIPSRLPERAEAVNAIPEDRAERAGLGYLALGDWHGALRIAPRSWYSGTPETDRHRANASGSVHVVTLDGGAEERVETVATGHYRWIRREIDLLDGTAEGAVDALAALEAEASRIVMALEFRGVIGLAARKTLADALERHAARFHHLEVDDTALVDEPRDDDLDAIDTGGFVRLAIERLRRKAADPAEPQRDAARMALRMIYLDHAGRP